MSVLNIPNILVQGTTINAAPFNANFSAVQTAVNNVDNSNVGASGFFASQLLPTTLGQATFGGAIGYLHLAPSASTTPLTVSGVTSQSADIFDVTLTSGGTKAFSIGGSGNAYFPNVVFVTLLGQAGVSIPGSANSGDLVIQRSASTGQLFLGGTTSATLDFGLTTASVVSLNRSTTINGLLGVSNATALSTPGGSLATGDIVAQRSSVAGAISLGGASNSNLIDFNLTTANTVSFQRPGVGYTNMNGGTYTNSSDVSLKTNVAAIADPIAIIMSLKPVSFDWKHDGSSSLGFIAQDVQGILPQLVSTDNNGSMGVNYDGMIPVCVATNQEIISKLRAAGITGF